MTVSGGGVEVNGLRITAQRAVAERMKELWRRVRSRAYTARRGVINWAAFEWGEHDRATAIFFADSTVGQEINDATVVWHVFGKLGDPNTDGRDLDDELLEELRDDAVLVINELVTSQDDKGDSLLLGFFPESVTIQEAYDLEAGVQGIVVLFDIGI